MASDDVYTRRLKQPAPWDLWHRVGLLGVGLLGSLSNYGVQLEFKACLVFLELALSANFIAFGDRQSKL